MKILVVGGAGFIGSHLMKRLIYEGHEVIGFDSLYSATPIEWREQLNVVVGNICGRGSLDSLYKLVRECDFVYHLAAQVSVDRSIEAPLETLKVNVMGTENVLEACRKYDKPVLFTSSSEVYGTAQTKRVSEDHPLHPQTPYAVSKLAGEKLCICYWETYGLKTVIIRPFNTFGESQSDRKYGGFIPVFTRRVVRGETPIIHGDGFQTRDYLYVDDTVRGFIAVAKAGKHGVPINVCSGRELTINYIAEKIIEYAGVNVEPIHVEPRPNDVRRMCGDNRLAKCLGWKPKCNFEHKLRRFVKWFKKKRM